MARPSKYAEGVAGTVTRAAAVGVPLSAAAGIAGVSASTLYAWKAKFPEFRDQLDQAHAAAVGKAVRVLDESTDWRAAAWWLERQCPQEFGPPEVA
jgi:hypothetical protein